MMGLIFQPNKPWQEATAALAALLDESYKAVKDAEPRRQYLGASILGDDCERKVAFNYHGTDRDPDKGFSGKTYRIFDMGHDGESRMAGYLRCAGFEIVTEGKDGRQLGFSVAEGKFAGHIDGAIISGPDVKCPWPALWENKALGAKSWIDVALKGIQKSKPTYYVQVQIYMAYMELERCLFTCLNRDTGDVYAEVIALDLATAQKFSDRAARIIESASPFESPRCTTDESDYRCGWCDYKTTCWKARIPEHATVTEKPAWL
jgi:hypothetical protein